MKKVWLLFICLVFVQLSSGQITFNSAFSNPNASNTFPPRLDKFHSSGYKYVFVNYSGLQINVYNTNFSLFKSISVPATVGGIGLTGTNYRVELLSEKLFDLDSLMEYALTVYVSTGLPYKAKTYIYKETGSQIFFRDSSLLYTFKNFDDDIFNNFNTVHFNGVNTVMRLVQTPFSPQNAPVFLYFDLPGSIPCAQCGTTGTVTGRQSLQGSSAIAPVFYPNPVTDQLKLKYELPKDYKNAEIKIFDVQGKLVETFKVTDTFDFIYLPSDYNNGLYLYSLSVDGKTIKTEKIILNK